MMNRSSSRDPMIGAGGRNHSNNNNHNAMTNGILPHRRGMPFAKNNAAENFNSNNNTDLFSRSRTSLPAASSDESDLQVRLARLSLGSAKPTKSVLDDLLSNNEGGKNDYDWLLTPPGTPLFPSTDDRESQQPARVTTRSKSSIRSSSINKTSRLSVSQSETNHQPRPARSSSVTRSSISTSQYTNYSNRNTNILNTSSASVSSYIRPSTPTKPTRPSTPSTTRTTTSSRPSTPSRTRPTPTSTHTPTRPSGNTRPSTPTSRPQTPGNVISSSPTIRPPSRSSTPTRRTLTPSLSPSTSSLPSVTRGLSTNGRSVGSTSRPSSPSPRVRPPPQPMNIIDFPHDTPPNLRTTLPDRPLSAGRSRPVGSGSVKGNLESTNSGSITRRHSSPNVVRGRVVPEPSGRGRNGNVGESLEARRSLNLPQSVARKPVKSASSESGTGFGRNISKKSLDMAIKHMDIRNGGPRPLSGSTLFPQSIRSTISRAHPGRAQSLDGTGSENGNYTNGYSWNRGGPTEDQSPLSSKLSSEVDIYESSRYDAILLKEDLKNTSWLHSGDDKTTDEGLLFDNGFESLPEPFGPL